MVFHWRLSDSKSQVIIIITIIIIIIIIRNTAKIWTYQYLFWKITLSKFSGISR